MRKNDMDLQHFCFRARSFHWKWAGVNKQYYDFTQFLTFLLIFCLKEQNKKAKINMTLLILLTITKYMSENTNLNHT